LQPCLHGSKPTIRLKVFAFAYDTQPDFRLTLDKGKQDFVLGA